MKAGAGGGRDAAVLGSGATRNAHEVEGRVVHPWTPGRQRDPRFPRHSLRLRGGTDADDCPVQGTTFEVEGKGLGRSGLAAWRVRAPKRAEPGATGHKRPGPAEGRPLRGSRSEPHACAAPGFPIPARRPVR